MLTRRFRVLAAVLVVAFVWLPTPSFGLGLGQIEVSSALNERFVGEIELLDLQDLQVTEVFVSLASREDFERVGVERFFYLTNLTFEVDLSGSVPRVVVESSQPVSEPYLNFIVEVLWPRGRLLKEYTVLLDPPTFSASVPPRVTAPDQPVAQPPSSQPLREEPAKPDATPEVSPIAAVEPEPPVDTEPELDPEPRRTPMDGVMTSRDDTLWSIAVSTKASKRVTVKQQMLAIQRKNPRAFMRDNINLLKAGYLLDMPTEEEALAVSSRQADADVESQAKDWLTERSGPQIAQETDSDGGSDFRSQIDATATDDAPLPVSSEGEGDVRIVANTGDLASGGVAEDTQEVNELIEEKDTLARQVDELTYQLDREKEIAANEVSVKERLLAIKDAEIAQMQEQMAQMQERLAQAQQNQDQSSRTDQNDTPWWGSPIVLLGAAAIVALIVIYGLFALRRRREEARRYDEVEDLDEQNDLGGPDDDWPGHEDDSDEGDDPDHDREDEDYSYDSDQLEDDEVDDDVLDVDRYEADDVDLESDLDNAIQDEADEERLSTESMASEGRADGAEALPPEESQSDTDDADPAGAPNDTLLDSDAAVTSDVIGEAEIYIAYGRYGQAVDLLAGALVDEPKRWDVRLKLLEVCLEAGDEEGFQIHQQFIQEHCPDQKVVFAASTLGEDAHTSEEGLSLTVDSEDENSNTSEFELEFDTDTQRIDDTPSNEETSTELDLDFELDEEDTITAAADDLDDLLGELDAQQTGQPATTQGERAEGEEAFIFDEDENVDINETKLDLAEAYVEMGDTDGAAEILAEVLQSGSSEQQQKAQDLLDRL